MMRLVIQKVKHANVMVDDEVCGKIGPGLLVFLGVHKTDKPENTTWLVNKLLNLRIYEDEGGKMNRSVKEINGEVLIVSQFTLYADCSSGRRPDLFEAASGPEAEIIYNKFVVEVEKDLGRVQTGRFGALMEINLCNVGPITLIIDGK